MISSYPIGEILMFASNLSQFTILLWSVKASALFITLLSILVRAC